MASDITPAQVPVVENLEYIPGFDASGNWGKIPGGDIAQAVQEASEAKATAEEASQTATEAKATAEEASQTAEDAQSTANTLSDAVIAAKQAGDSAKILADDLYGMMRKVYVVPLTSSQDYSVSALWFCNGLVDPSATMPPGNQKGAYNAIRCLPGSSTPEVKLRLLGLSEISGDITAAFTYFGNGERLTLYAGNIELGYFTPTGGAGAYLWSAYIMRGAIIRIDRMAECTFTPTYAGSNYLVMVSAGGSAVSVDSALSTTSENPVQNKAVAAALNAKAPLASPTFTGQPKAPTPNQRSADTRIATTAFVSELVSRQVTVAGSPSLWIKDGSVFLAATGSVELEIPPLTPIDEGLAWTAYVIGLPSTQPALITVIYRGNSYTTDITSVMQGSGVYNTALIIAAVEGGEFFFSAAMLPGKIMTGVVYDLTPMAPGDSVVVGRSTDDAEDAKDSNAVAEGGTDE